MEELSEFTSVYTLKIDISCNARNLEDAEAINNARMQDLKKALLYVLADGVNFLSENTEPIK